VTARAAGCPEQLLVLGPSLFKQKKLIGGRALHAVHPVAIDAHGGWLNIPWKQLP
jgi:hypothetical protein